MSKRGPILMQVPIHQTIGCRFTIDVLSDRNILVNGFFHIKSGQTLEIEPLAGFVNVYARGIAYSDRKRKRKP